MEIIFSDKENEYSISFENNVIIFGANNSGKTKILKSLNDAIKNGTAIVNSLKITKGDIDVCFFSEETDFNDEFSFTKSNIFRATIYNSIMNNINKEQLLKEVNLTFDKIDEKVNDYLEHKVSFFSDSNIKFDINIDDLDDIINKFTSVYINDLNESKKIPKSFKRKLIYQLALLDNNDKERIIIIDNFDLYLDTSNIIQVLNFISNYSSEHCHFILSSSNPLIYNYINKYFDIYKVTNNKLCKFPIVDDLIKKGILMAEFENSKELIPFEEFYSQNIHLINENDVNLFKKNYLAYQSTNIGIILTSNFVTFNDVKISVPFIFTKGNCELYFLKFLCEALLTEYEIIDIL